MVRAVTLLTALLAGAAALPAAAEPRAVIHFANHGGIEDWRARGNEALYIESRRDEWFKATFFGACFGLPFTETIAFVTEHDGSLDKFSSVLVDGQRCHFRTFEEIPEAPEFLAGSETEQVAE